jgi:uncharacterized membrane protein
MAFCPKCGAAVEGRFCPACGTAVDAPAGTAPAAAPGAPPPAAPPPVASAGMDENVAGALCYLCIPAIIFLILQPYNRNPIIRFHALQAIFLWVAYIALRIVMGALIFGIGWEFYLMLRSIILLAYLAMVVFMMYKTYNRQKVVLPVIGSLAQKS